MSRRPATALIAYVRALAMEEPVAQADLDALLRRIAADPAERAALIAGMGAANRVETGLLIADLARRLASGCEERAERLRARDEVVGVWAQRVLVGGALIGLGAGFSATIAAPLAGVVFAALLGAGGYTTRERLRLRRRAAAAARERRRFETLAEAVIEAAKSGDGA